MKNLVDVSKMQGIEEQKDYNEIFKSSIVSHLLELEEPEPIFEMKGVSVFERKSIGTIKGPPKSGKSIFLAFIMSFILPHYKTLYIDTETGIWWALKTLKYILNGAGYEHADNLTMIEIKKYNPTERLQVIEAAIKATNPDLVVLDGCRDICYNINDSEEAVLRVGDMMRWADEFDCSVVTVIHTNKADNHARGHLGQELSTKSSTVINISKCDDVPNGILVEPGFSRGLPFEPFVLQRDENDGAPYLSNHIPSNSKGTKKPKSLHPRDVDRITHLEVLQKIYRTKSEFKYGDLVSELVASVDFFTKISQSKAKEFIAFYRQEEYLNESKGYRNSTVLKFAYSLPQIEDKNNLIDTVQLDLVSQPTHLSN